MVAPISAASRNLADQCISGLKATQRGPEMVDMGLAIVTTLVPHIGYDAAAAIAKEAAASGQTIREVAKDKTELTDAELDLLLMEIYSFGGAGNPGAAPQNRRDAIDPESIRWKRAALEAYDEVVQAEGKHGQVIN